MVNNTPDSKLDEAVKNALKDFEASNATADWSRMDNMLNASPKASTINWKYSLRFIIGAAVITGAFITYKQISKTTSIPENKSEIPVTNTEPTVTKQIVQPLKENIVVPSVPVTDNTTELSTSENTTTATPVEEKKDLKTTADIKTKKEKNTEKNKTAKNTTAAEDVKLHPVIGMGNEPIFGDMLDSSKGVIGNTQEKETTKKAAKTQSNKNIGWDNFMFSNVNPDSIRKHREAMKKDSLKN
ncbi:MAG: hypothetical protein J0L87_00515 [Bacteroidetes bacterium]|nr:hypothetical protein [Bacteroidota bacterium]